MHRPLWQKTESKHFVFYYFPDSYAAEIIDRLVQERETAFTKLNQIFQVELPEKIRWYFFPSREEGIRLLHSSSPSSAFPVALTIFTVYGKVDGKIYDSTPGHELTHILSFYWHDNFFLSPYLFLSEGLARYSDQIERNDNQLVKEFTDKGKLIKFADILNMQDFKNADSSITYVQSASFVKYLIEKYGWEKFEKTWVVKENLDHELTKIYCLSLTNLEQEWIKFINQL